MTDRKKERNKKLCRMPDGQPWFVNGQPVYEDATGDILYDTCNCDQTLHLASLLEEVLDNNILDDNDLFYRIMDAIDLTKN